MKKGIINNNDFMNEFFKSFGEARDKARKYHFKCLYLGCSRKAIKSHLVQQHPILASIAEYGKLYQIYENEVNPMSGDFSDFKEKHISVQKALSLPLFCSEHDNALFKPIETGEIDMNSTNTFLLFSYRALAAQRYLEEKRQVFYQNTGYEGPLFDSQREYSMHIIARFDCTMEHLLYDIENKLFDDYTFNVLDLPFLPLCGSDAMIEEDKNYCEGVQNAGPLNTLYLTLLPMVDKSVLKLIIGYHKRFVGIKQKILYKKILNQKSVNTIIDIVCRMKNWCCSPSYINNSDFLTIYETRRNELLLDEDNAYI